jgi:hypothetical protein
MCMLNRGQTWLKIPFCTFFKNIQETSPYIYTTDCATNECEHVLCDAYDRRFTKIKAKKHMFCLPKLDTSAWQNRTSDFLSTTRKTGTSSLENRTIRFFQVDHIDKKTNTNEFKAFICTY